MTRPAPAAWPAELAPCLQQLAASALPKALADKDAGLAAERDALREAMEEAVQKRGASEPGHDLGSAFQLKLARVFT